MLLHFAKASISKHETLWRGTFRKLTTEADAPVSTSYQFRSTESLDLESTGTKRHYPTALQTTRGIPYTRTLHFHGCIPIPK